jgi:hypothetical protein
MNGTPDSVSADVQWSRFKNNIKACFLSETFGKSKTNSPYGILGERLSRIMLDLPG